MGWSVRRRNRIADVEDVILIEPGVSNQGIAAKGIRNYGQGTGATGIAEDCPTALSFREPALDRSRIRYGFEYGCPTGWRVVVISVG